MNTASHRSNGIENKQRAGGLISLPGESYLNKAIITLSGKAGQAFKLFDLFCQEYGNLTLGELSKKLSKGYLVIWRAQ